MSIAIRIIIGGAVILVGLIIYGFVRFEVETRKDISWGDVIVYLVLGFVGLGIIGFGDRILDWTSLPDLVRWTIIGILLVAGIACYFGVQRNLDRYNDTTFLLMYGLVLFLFFAGIRLIFLEFGIEP